MSLAGVRLGGAMDNRTRMNAIAVLIGGALILPAPGMAITFGFDGLVVGGSTQSYDEEGFRITCGPGWMYASSIIASSVMSVIA